MLNLIGWLIMACVNKGLKAFESLPLILGIPNANDFIKA